MEKIAILLLMLLVMTGAEAKQFLVVPLARSSNPTITEGWLYSQQEQQIHGYPNHKGIDFACSYGTAVYAATDGWAIQSFHSRLLPERLWQGKTVGYALGHFVQIWHPEQQKYTCYGHLSRVAESIPCLRPVQSKAQPHDWDPKGIYLVSGVAPDGAVWIRRGDLVGYVGDSGLTWGYDETPDQRPDREQFPSWDEPHLHFEVYTRDAQGQKNVWFDPFCLYSTAEAYNLSNPVGVSELWLFDQNHNILWAR